MKKKEMFPWSTMDTKQQTIKYIDYVEDYYFDSYDSESFYYEKINNLFFISVTIIGFLVTIIIGLKEILNDFINNSMFDTTVTIITFILPSVSSLLLIYWNQKGYKRKEEIREEARIECKYIVNEARIRFSKINDNPDEYEELYRWLNEQTRLLQLSQAKNYFSVHNVINKETSVSR